jgi:hypothetical protein
MPNKHDDITASDLLNPFGLIRLASSNSSTFYLILTVVGVFILGYFVFRSSTLESLKSLGSSLNGFSLNGAEYFSVGFAIMGGTVMLLLALSFFPDYDRVRLTLMLEMSGAVLGWILGMFLTPASQSEQETFLNAKTALVGVVSGYLLSKLQTLFDKMVAENKVLNKNALQYGLSCFVPLILSTAAVYNVRAYQDQRVLITPGASGDLATITSNGKSEYKLALSKSAAFVAEARFPSNSAVEWSVDPAELHGTIDPHTGEYKAPDQMPNDPIATVVAISLGDKTKIGRFPITLVRTETKANPANSETPTKQAAPKASKDGATENGKRKDAEVPGKGNVVTSDK